MRDTTDTIIVGGGAAGLSAAIALASAGRETLLLEMGASCGGKMRPDLVAGREVDAGPTVFTMKWVFDALFAESGARFDDAVALTPATVLARHAWDPGPGGGSADWFDLPADAERADEAVEDFAGPAEAARFRSFRENAERIYRPLQSTMMTAQQTGPLGVAARLGALGSATMARRAPPVSLWRALTLHLRDPRLRQLFARYATYCGSSPFLAPSALMLVSHVERDGVWSVAGGMAALGTALARHAEDLGVQIRTNARVSAITARSGRVDGVRLADGSTIGARRVVFAGDAAALDGLVDADTALGPTPEPEAGPTRSLSAVVTTALARLSGAAPHHHTVFFSDAYRHEFDQIFNARRAPENPTTYLCAQDRSVTTGARTDGAGADGYRDAERIQLLVNAPSVAPDAPSVDAEAVERRALELLARCGVEVDIDAAIRKGPTDFARLYPGSNGALYGPATHGFMGAFNRRGARTALDGLYLASGSAHPGPGVPMSALSGRLAAEALTADADARAAERSTAGRTAQLRRVSSDASSVDASFARSPRTERS